MKEDSPQGIWDNIAEKMLLEFAESGCPIFRATTLLSRGKLKSKGHGKLSIHFGATQETIENIFRIIVSVSQLSLYGAVANMCEEYESLHDRSGQPDKVVGQSIVLSEIKTEVPLDNDDPAYQNILLQRYEERIEKLSQQDKLSKFCMDAGFKSVVENGQYFMTKDTGEQFHAVACREYTLPREDGSSQPRGWIQGDTKIGPVLEVATSYLHGKNGVEIRIWSLNKDNSQSWVKISHGSNKFVMDSHRNSRRSARRICVKTELQEETDRKNVSCLRSLEFHLLRKKPNSCGTSRSVLDLSWFGLRPFPCVKGTYLRLDFKGPAPSLQQAEHEKFRRQQAPTIVLMFWTNVQRKKKGHQFFSFENTLLTAVPVFRFLVSGKFSEQSCVSQRLIKNVEDGAVDMTVLNETA